jgi:hypothetical protein
VFSCKSWTMDNVHGIDYDESSSETFRNGDVNTLVHCLIGNQCLFERTTVDTILVSVF